jgi:c-di-GMP-binding flagellar brake protein YcgR
MDNRRQHQRFRAAVAAEVEIDAELYEGATRDLSSGGASLLLRAPLVDGMQLALTLFLTEDGIESPDEEPLTLQAQVVWLGPPRKGEVLAGVRFVSPSAEDTQRLERLLSALEPVAKK